MRKTGVMLLTILLILLCGHPARVQALDRFEDLLPAIDPDSTLSPVQNLRFQTQISAEGDRRLRILWDSVTGADSYYVLYSFSLNGVAYPNSKLLEAGQLYYEPTVLGCGLHTFRVYPLVQNRTCDAVSVIDVFVASNTFFPSMLKEGQSVDYYTSSAIELGLERFRRMAETDVLPETTDVRKLRAIHDTMRTAIEYSTAESDVYRAVLSGTGLCDVYARGVKILCDLSGIPCEYIVGRAGAEGVDYESHAWNMVALDGAYYHVDATWDDIEDSYRYFLVPDTEIEKTHVAETETRPTADSGRFMIEAGQFDMGRLRLHSGETRTVGVKIQPQEAAFRAGFSLSDSSVAGCEVVGDSLSVTAYRAGVTSLQLSDGETGFDTLWIEVTDETTGDRGAAAGSKGEEGQNLTWLWYLFWGVLFLVSCVGVFRFKNSGKRDRYS